MIPIVDGQIEQFAARGLYNGLALLSDYSTGSYWDHITGECVHGERAGMQLDFTDFDLLYTTVHGALQMRPDAAYALSEQQSLHARFIKFVQPFIHKLLGNRLPPHFARTTGAADTRRDTMDLGLGIWTGGTHRYYPLATLKAAPKGIVDSIDGRTLFVHYNTLTQAPDAVFISANGVADYHADCIRFDDGSVLANGQRQTATGEALPLERPQQMFTRWYGFSYTFPDCEIYSA